MLLNRIRAALRRRRLEVVFSPSYSTDLGGTPIDPQRAERILAFLLAAGMTTAKRVHHPREASLKELLRVHEVGYLESLRKPGALTPVVGFPVPDAAEDRAIEAQRYATGGTLLATERALEREALVVNLGGGFHHAEPGRGKGFCLFNDVAVAIRTTRERGFGDPIAVIDLDLHDGDGTRIAFAEDPSVFTFSIHNRHWDLRPAVASRSIELSGEVEDEEYLATVAEHLPGILSELRPGLVFYLAGADPAFDDRLGNWKISPAAMLRRDRLVFETVKETLGRVPRVMLLAGGYGRHTWRYPARFLGWHVTRRPDFEPPTTTEITLMRYRKLFQLLDASHLQGEPGRGPDELWDLSEDDVYGGLGASARPTRLLGHFSRHGVELILEGSGLLERLRDKGFAHPTLELDLDNPTGQTVRVFSDVDRAELLIEVRMKRDLSTAPELRLLRLEWLLIQDPRSRFSGDRPALPGQTHPGLGLLTDLMAIIVIIAERLRLDGVLFVPSHYHLAAKGRKYLRFVDPAHHDWLRAVDRAVAGLSLLEATQAVAAGRLVYADSGKPVAWQPMPMVIPVSELLRDRLGPRPGSDDPGLTEPGPFRLAPA
jgi:acetoin utilization deacetylase AcuC-like enzyme